MKQKSCVCSLWAVVFVSVSALAGEQSWLETPASAIWNTTDLNWDAGAAWTQNSRAVFGASSSQSIRVAGPIWANGMTVTASDYAFAGPATDSGTGLFLASDNPVNNEQVDIPVDVASDASVTFNTYVKMFSLDAFYKKGAGTATLSLGGSGLQVISHGGTLRLTGGTFRTAKVYKKTADATADLHLDNVTLQTWNPNKIVGHPNRFNSATIGEHGFTIQTDMDAELHQCFSTAAGVAADGGIQKTGAKQLLVVPQNGEKSSFTGGFTVVAGELAVANTDGLGTGAVVVKSGTGVTLQDAALKQTHVYKLERGGAFGAIGADYLVDRPGELPAFADSNFRKILGLGRVSGQASTLTLAPVNDMRLGGVDLVGTLNLTLGGSIKVGELVGDRFFRTDALVNGASIQVDPKGLVLDVPGNVRTELGIPLAMFRSGMVAESTTVDDFEANNCGWTLAKNGSADGDPSRSGNGGSFIKSADYYTSDGSAFIYLRRKNYMQKSITIPSAGQWRVVFLAGCRPGYNSHKLTMTVAFGGNSHTFPARDALHGFREFATPVYVMEKDATPQVRITLGDGDQWTGMGIDRVRLERVGDVDVPFTKTGTGALALNGFMSAGNLTVSAGTLDLESADLANAQVTVTSGATLALGRVRLDGTQVSVASGATIALRPAGVNLVKNGSFEEPGGTTETAWQFTDCPPWTFGKLPGRGGNGSGCQNNGSTVSTASAYQTPYGCTTAYLRSQNWMKQEVSVPADGEYVLSFVHSQRDYGQDPGYLNPISVKIDTDEVVNIPARKAKIPFTRVTTAPIPLTAGAHILEFQNLGKVGNPDGAMVFIDDVSLVEKALDIDFANDARVDLVEGSIVRLDNSEPLEFAKGTFSVNGKPFNGSQNTLKAQGIVIEGEGKIQIGAKIGSMLIVR